MVEEAAAEVVAAAEGEAAVEEEDRETSSIHTRSTPHIIRI